MPSGDPWTEEADQVLRDLYANGRSDRDMSLETGRTVAAIERRKHLLGIRGGGRVCRCCGKDLPVKQGRPGNYCSDACGAWQRYEDEHGHLKAEVVPCPQCGDTFLRSPTAKYCSLKCSKAAWYARAKLNPDFLLGRSKRSAARRRELMED